MKFIGRCHISAALFHARMNVKKNNCNRLCYDSCARFVITACVCLAASLWPFKIAVIKNCDREKNETPRIDYAGFLLVSAESATVIRCQCNVHCACGGTKLRFDFFPSVAFNS